MRRRLPAIVAALVCAAASAGAQPVRAVPTADTGPGVEFVRARRLVSDGNAALGRALVDTLLAAATPGSPAYAEALFWRATLAERASDAERDYRQIAVEYANSPRAVDALVRLAQLDLVRGQPNAAREHLTRLLRDHDDAPTRARANFWLARAALDANDTKGACDALNDAAGAAEPGGDLARQVVALRTRVPRCTLRVAVGANDSAPSVAKAAPKDAPKPVERDVPKETPKEVAKVAPVPNATRSPVPNAPAAAHGATVFSVQLAAYDSRAGAEALAARLAKRGIEAHVEAGGATPDAPPFRVRVGRFAARAEAVAALRDLKAKGLAGFVAAQAP